MNNQILRSIDDIRKRVDAVYVLTLQSDNDIRKRVDDCYRAIWRLYKVAQEKK